VRILGAVIGVALIAFFGLCYFAGVFDKVEVSVADVGPYAVVFRDHTGPYRDIRFVIRDVYGYLSEKRSVFPKKGFALFYDNPRKTKQQDLHSIGGYITDSLLTGVSVPYAVKILPKTESIIGTFPLRTFMSAMTGPMKFYPEMFKLLTEKKREIAGPVMEIYDASSGRIMYVAWLK
jgi:hypothetical protein